MNDCYACGHPVPEVHGEHSYYRSDCWDCPWCHWDKTYDGAPFRIAAQDSHRNGVGGAPFVATLIDAWIGETLRKFICTSFYACNEIALTPELRKAAFVEQTSALEVGELVGENVDFGCGNSWRGADMFGPAIAEAWQNRCRYDSEWGGYDPFDYDWEPPTAGVIIEEDFLDTIDDEVVSVVPQKKKE